MRENDWTEKDSDTAAVVTATRAAATNGNVHVIVSVAASYSDPTISGLLQILFGATVMLEHYVHGADVVPFAVRGNQNEAVSATLASGGGAVVGKISIAGYSE